MAEDIFKFDDRDLVNLQKWLRRAPKQFIRASANVVNTMAFDSRRNSIKNLKSGTTTRNQKFIDRSIRVTKSKTTGSLSQIVAEMGSIDISRSGRSSGFKELETGGQSDSNRVPTLASRNNQQSKKVAGPVRMNKLSRMVRHRMIKGKGTNRKRGQVAAMLRVVRSGALGRQPFIMPRGIKSGRMRSMPEGVWKLGNRGQLNLMNPFKGKRKRTRKIAWSHRAVVKSTADSNLRKIWSDEVDFILRKSF